MKSYNLIVLFTILLCMICTKAAAHDIYVENADGKTIYYIWSSDKTELLVSYRGGVPGEFGNCFYSGNIVIPSSVDYNGVTYSVISIRMYAFRGQTALHSVVMPNTITFIGSSAFSDCTTLTSVTIGSGLTAIGSSAFSNCKNLTLVTLNNNVLITKGHSLADTFGKQVKKYVIGNSVTSIGSSAFKGCTGLTSIEIPNSVTSIGSSAFKGCTGLTSIEIPNSVTSIGFSAFSGCTGLTSIEIPNSVTIIDEGTFQNCTGLTSIEIPNSVTRIYNNAFDGTGWYDNQPDGLIYLGKWLLGYKGNMTEKEIAISEGTKGIACYAFKGCSGLTSVTIPNSVTSIGDEAFRGCRGLTSLTISNRVTSISDYAFAGCSGLTSLTIPNSVTSISDYAFAGCSGLTSLTIPNSVTSIGESAFNDCSGLTELISHATTPPVCRNGAFYYINKKCKLFVPKGCVEAYRSADQWKAFSFISDDIPKYKLTYVVDGEEYKSYELEYGASIAPEDIPTKEGYTFSGWSEMPEMMPNHDVTVTGTFTKNVTAKYKLIYKVDSEVYKTYEMEEGAPITPEPAPTKEGYTFSGWSEIPKTMPDHDVTVTGTFTKSVTAKYKLIYKVDGEVYKTYEIKEGTTITPEPAPTREGYTFSGWSEIPQTMPDHDVTIAGTFTKNPENLDINYVDLGLPSGLLWATCNLGATSPEEVGGYYAWGETSPKTFFSQGNYTYKSNPISLNDISGTEYDAAAFTLGGTWRIPTREELVELANKCTREETTLNGKACMKFTGPNGNSLYLPKGGFGDEGKGVGLNGYGLWSSTKCGSSTAYRAWEWTNISMSYTWQGIPIRPVTSKKPVVNGDANGDGMMNAYDIIDIVNHTMGKPISAGMFDVQAADMNKDGVVNIADIVQIVNNIMGK